MGPDVIKEVERCRSHLDRAVADEQLARVKLEAAMVRAGSKGAAQRDIASAASVSQPYVSQVLAERRGRFVPSSRLGYLLAARRDDVIRVARRHGIENIRVFGSVARGEDGPESDIDLIADLPSGMGLIGLSKVEAELSDVLGVGVDLVPARSLKAHVRSSAMRDAVVL